MATIESEFFTPERQIAYCGHATIANFSRMSELGLVKNGRLSKETIDGTREIIVDSSISRLMAGCIGHSTRQIEIDV